LQGPPPPSFEGIDDLADVVRFMKMYCAGPDYEVLSVLSDDLFWHFTYKIGASKLAAGPSRIWTINFDALVTYALRDAAKKAYEADKGKHVEAYLDWFRFVYEYQSYARLVENGFAEEEAERLGRLATESGPHEVLAAVAADRLLFQSMQRMVQRTHEEMRGKTLC
jgi:hypothetical protein